MKKVLLVEDTVVARALIRIYLMGGEIECHEAHDGEQGLALARELKPDLIISDVEMPRMDGLTFCAAVRADGALHATPVVLLTARDDEVTRRKGRLIGATEFLVKPVTARALRQLVGVLLGIAL